MRGPAAGPLFLPVNKGGRITAIDQGDPAVYANFLANEGPERVRAAYPGARWQRLVEIKRRYDPTNLFRLNQNIEPGAAAT